MWPRIVADPSTLGRHVCYVCKRSVCGGGRATACRTLEPQTAVCSPKLENNGFPTGINIPATMRGPHVVEQSGQCARALTVDSSQGVVVEL